MNREVDYRRLTDSEVLGMVLRETGGDAIATNLLSKFDNLKELLFNSELVELMEVEGVGKRRANQLKAMAELLRRLNRPQQEKLIVNTPDAIAEVMIDRLKYLKQECFEIILLTAKNHVLSIENVTIGILDECHVHPREVFNRAIRKHSSRIIICHNHPGGSLKPSSADLQLTKRLVDAGKLLGIEVLDHLIVTDTDYVSLKQDGFM